MASVKVPDTFTYYMHQSLTMPCPDRIFCAESTSDAQHAPMINTRGVIFTTPGSIVLRSTCHVFDLFVNAMDDVVDTFSTIPTQAAALGE